MIGDVLFYQCFVLCQFFSTIRNQNCLYITTCIYNYIIILADLSTTALMTSGSTSSMVGSVFFLFNVGFSSTSILCISVITCTSLVWLTKWPPFWELAACLDNRCSGFLVWLFPTEVLRSGEVVLLSLLTLIRISLRGA